MSPIVRFIVAWTRFCAEHRAELMDVLALAVLAVLVLAWVLFVPDALVSGPQPTNGP